MDDPRTHAESPPVPPALLEAAYRQGWLMADEAFRHLEAAGILPDRAARRKRRVAVSPAILMELAAALRLGSWAEGGLCACLNEADVGPAFAALETSEARLTSDAAGLAREEGLPPLTDQVFGIWRKYLAWGGLDELGADVVLDLTPADEEALLEELADLLWQQRRAGPQPTEG